MYGEETYKELVQGLASTIASEDARDDVEAALWSLVREVSRRESMAAHVVEEGEEAAALNTVREVFGAIRDAAHSDLHGRRRTNESLLAIGALAHWMDVFVETGIVGPVPALEVATIRALSLRHPPDTEGVS